MDMCLSSKLQPRHVEKVVMPIEDVITNWTVLPWENDMNRDDLLVLQIRHLERRPKDIEIAVLRLKESKLKNKERFDKKHRLCSHPIEKQHWVLVYDSSLDNQHSTMRKVTKRWFAPYV